LRATDPALERHFLVVSQNTEPALLDNQINDPARMWTPVDQITNKAELIILWAFLDQRHKRVKASIHIANHYQVSLHHLTVRCMSAPHNRRRRD
jgi:hypothetical protein